MKYEIEKNPEPKRKYDKNLKLGRNMGKRIEKTLN